jgi:hypothetical protein
VITGLILWLLSVQGIDCSQSVCNVHDSKDHRYHYVMVCDPNKAPSVWDKHVGRITFMIDDGSGVIDLIDLPTKPVSCGTL